MGGNGKVLKCGISEKQLIIGLFRWEFGTWGLKDYLHMYVTAFHAKLLEFSLGSFDAAFKETLTKSYCSLSFHANLTKYHGKYCNHRELQALALLAMCN